MRRRKLNSAGNSGKKRRISLRPAGALAIVLFILLIIIAYGANTLKKANFFAVKGVIVIEGDKKDFSYLVGKNIFNIDLEAESEYISQLYPSYNKVRLIRVLPDKIFVDFKERKPVAYIKLYRLFAVDEDGVLVNFASGEHPDLPVIIGLDTKIFGPKIGIKYNIADLRFALDLLQQMKLRKNLSPYRITSIDVSMPGQVSMLIDGRLEVKMGRERLADMCAILSGLFNQARGDLENMQYIDLRFKEPVIKFRDVTKK